MSSRIVCFARSEHSLFWTRLVVEGHQQWPHVRLSVVGVSSMTMICVGVTCSCTTPNPVKTCGMTKKNDGSLKKQKAHCSSRASHQLAIALQVGGSGDSKFRTPGLRSSRVTTARLTGQVVRPTFYPNTLYPNNTQTYGIKMYIILLLLYYIILHYIILYIYIYTYTTFIWINNKLHCILENYMELHGWDRIIWNCTQWI